MKRRVSQFPQLTKAGLTQALTQMEGRLNKKFVAIDGKFAAIGRKFDAIDTKFSGIDGRFTTFEQSMDRTLARQKGDILTTLDLRLAQQKEDILREMDKKFVSYQEAVIQGVTSDIHDMLMPEIEKHDDRLEALERHTMPS